MAHALECGRLLLQVKDQLPHGHFMRWVRANTDVEQRTANNWMKLAQNSNAVSHLGVRQALKMLAAPKKPRKRQSAPLIYEVIDPTGFDFMESDARRRSMESPAETEEAEEEAQDEDAAP
jgi:hypothetical protein